MSGIEKAGMKYRFLTVLLLVAGMIPALSAARVSGLPMTSLSAAGTGLTPFYVLGFELGPWQDYLARELTPDFMLDPTAESLRVSWLDEQSVFILPAFAKQLLGEPETFLRLEVDWQYSDELAMNSFDPVMNSGTLGLERRLISPGLMHRLNDNQLIGVSAVFATQSYGVSRLGLQSYDQSLPANLRSSVYDPYQETGYGAGVSLALRSEIRDGITMDAGFQSRINMNEFANYRGVYSQPADLDIPARARFGLAFQASDKSWLNVSVERVLYSEVGAFASRNLPGRFLSLLGDSTSPSFSWDDLTVYTVGWAWADNKGSSWHIDFSSRSQPLPSSKILSQAIDSDLAQNAMMIGYSRRMSMSSRFNVNAAYAPAEYAFGGNVLGVTTDQLNQDIELEANWTWDF
jgi:long-chain fatty acid transport protein